MVQSWQVGRLHNADQIQHMRGGETLNCETKELTDRERSQQKLWRMLDTPNSKIDAVAKKVATLLAESEATVSDVDKILLQAKKHLTVNLRESANHSVPE